MAGIYSEIESKIASLKGRSRLRTLEAGDICRIIAEALADGAATTGGGTVANKYGYPAHQMVACANKTATHVHVAVGWKSASKGTSQIPTRLPSNRVADLPKWDGTGADWSLTISQARSLVRQWRVKAGFNTTLPKSLWSVTVTIEDSLMCGNCATYTQRVADAIGKRVATGREVYLWVRDNMKDQLPRAIRAIRAAAARQAAVDHGVQIGYDASENVA